MNPAEGKDLEEFRRGGPQWIYATPLLAAPLLPLSNHFDFHHSTIELREIFRNIAARIALRKRPELRNRVFGGLIALFSLHGFFLIRYSYNS